VAFGAGENRSLGTLEGCSADLGVAPVLNCARAGVEDWREPGNSTSMSISDVSVSWNAENVGIGGYMLSLCAAPGERGHTPPLSLAPGVAGTSSNDVLNGCSLGGDNNEFLGSLEDIRRIVVVAGSWDILRRASGGAGRPARASCPGIGSTSGSSSVGAVLRDWPL